MCARCDVFWERLCKRRGASSVEQRETMCKMRRIVQNVGFRAVKIHLFDVKHAQMFWAATHNRRAFGRICCRRSRLVGATYVVPSAPFSPRGDGWVYALPRYRRCNRSICARLCRVLSRKECGGSFEGARSAARWLGGCTPGASCLLELRHCPCLDVCVRQSSVGANGERRYVKRGSAGRYCGMCMRVIGVIARNGGSVVFAGSYNVRECRICVANKCLGVTSYVRCGGSVKVCRYLFRA